MKHDIYTILIEKIKEEIKELEQLKEILELLQQR